MASYNVYGTAVHTVEIYDSITGNMVNSWAVPLGRRHYYCQLACLSRALDQRDGLFFIPVACTSENMHHRVCRVYTHLPVDEINGGGMEVRWR